MRKWYEKTNKPNQCVVKRIYACNCHVSGNCKYYKANYGNKRCVNLADRNCTCREAIEEIKFKEAECR
ncbi:MAG: hypothetical protein FWB90_00645 [Fibromonadales bacterium]|nr:hypothetical protein [Fibromonadales bacterium]